MRITAVCPCGDEWTFDGKGSSMDRMHAAAAIMFAVDRITQVKAYNLHLTDRKKHPKGR